MWWYIKCHNLWPNEDEPRDSVHIPFIENLGGAHMCNDCAGTNPGCLGGKPMAAPETAICIHEKCSASNQEHLGLTDHH